MTTLQAEEERAPSFLEMGLGEFLYYVAFTLYVLNFASDYTTFVEFLSVPVAVWHTIFQAAILMLLFGKFMIQRASFGGWVVAASLVLIGFLSWKRSGEGWLFWLALFVVCANGVRLRPLACIVFAVFLATIVVTITFAGVGMIENRLSVRAGVARSAMGFTHPNTLGLYLFVTCMAFSVMRFGKNPVPDLLMIAVADVINLTAADSRTTVLLSAFQALLLIVFYCVRGENGRRIARCCFVALVVGLLLLSVYFMVCYNPSNSLHATINKVLSGRLRLAHGYYTMQPLTLLGSKFDGLPPIYYEDGAPKTFVVDNAWCHLILRFGIIPALLFIAGFLVLFFRLLREKRWNALLFGLVLMMVYGFSESFGIRFECNFFLYALGSELLYSNHIEGLSGNGQLSAEMENGKAVHSYDGYQN